MDRWQNCLWSQNKTQASEDEEAADPEKNHMKQQKPDPTSLIKSLHIKGLDHLSLSSIGPERDHGDIFSFQSTTCYLCRSLMWDKSLRLKRWRFDHITPPLHRNNESFYTKKMTFIEYYSGFKPLVPHFYSKLGYWNQFCW